jgi:hypothetical protein
MLLILPFSSSSRTSSSRPFSLSSRTFQLTGRGVYIQSSIQSIKLRDTFPVLRPNDQFCVATMLGAPIKIQRIFSIAIEMKGGQKMLGSFCQFFPCLIE